MTTFGHKANSEMTVRQIAARADVSTHIVRNYLRSGLLRAARRSPNGYQLFGLMELHRLRFIRVSQRLGFSLREISEIIRRSRRGESPCPLVRDIVARRLRETAAEISQQRQLMRTMSNAAAMWSRMPDSAPTGGDICHLIEAVASRAPPTATGDRLSGMRSRRIRSPSTKKPDHG